MAVLHSYTFNLDISDDTAEMAQLMAELIQTVAREMTGRYIAVHRADDAVSITHHAVALLLSYCATISVNVIRRSEEGGEAMTRKEAAHLFMLRVLKMAEDVVGGALDAVEKLEAEEKLRFAQPEGEA